MSTSVSRGASRLRRKQVASPRRSARAVAAVRQDGRLGASPHPGNHAHLPIRVKGARLKLRGDGRPDGRSKRATFQKWLREHAPLVHIGLYSDSATTWRPRPSIAAGASWRSGAGCARGPRLLRRMPQPAHRQRITGLSQLPRRTCRAAREAASPGPRIDWAKVGRQDAADGDRCRIGAPSLPSSARVRIPRDSEPRLQTLRSCPQARVAPVTRGRSPVFALAFDQAAELLEVKRAEPHREPQTPVAKLETRRSMGTRRNRAVTALSARSA